MTEYCCFKVGCFYIIMLAATVSPFYLYFFLLASDQTTNGLMVDAILKIEHVRSLRSLLKPEVSARGPVAVYSVPAERRTSKRTRHSRFLTVSSASGKKGFSLSKEAVLGLPPTSKLNTFPPRSRTL